MSSTDPDGRGWREIPTHRLTSAEVDRRLQQSPPNRALEALEGIRSGINILTIAILVLVGCIGWLLLYQGKW